MPTITVYPTQENRSVSAELASLPPVLRTPSGLAIVEIQGTIKFSAPAETEPDGEKMPASSVGKLVFPNHEGGKGVYLYVGRHQRLTGEVKKLANPVAVLRRREDGAGDGGDELEIAEIVHYKILFGSRPEPVGGDGHS